MHVTRFLTRTVFHCLAVGLLMLALSGCSSHKPMTEQTQVKAKKKAIELNPFNWDLKEANYNFRDKYNFKVGNMWIVKPPRVLNLSQVVVVRELSSMPREPESQNSVFMMYEQYAQQDGIRQSDALVAADVEVLGSTQSKTRRQKMVIDLGTCDAIFEDADGKKYPCQIDPSMARQILNLASDRMWFGEKKTKIKQVHPDEWGYRALFQENDSKYKPVKRGWKISETSVNADVSPIQQLLTQAFEVAHRAVHPLSESVNLLK